MPPFCPFSYATVTSQFWGVEVKLTTSLPLSHLVTDLETPNQCINCEAFFLQTGSLISPVKNNFYWKICNFNFYRATLCYSAVFAVVMCLSVCLSVHRSVCQNPVSKRLDKSSWVLACRLPSTYPTLFSVNSVTYKNKVTSLWTFVPNSGLEKFRHVKSIALSSKLVDGRACWRHLYDDRRVVAVYYKSVNCNSVTPLLRFAVDLLYNLNCNLHIPWYV